MAGDCGDGVAKGWAIVGDKSMRVIFSFKGGHRLLELALGQEEEARVSLTVNGMSLGFPNEVVLRTGQALEIAVVGPPAGVPALTVVDAVEEPD